MADQSGRVYSEAERIKVAVRGDINHLIQPVIGHLRMYSEATAPPPSREDVAGIVRRLYVALAVVDAIGDDEARAALGAQEGLGLPATPESDARNVAELQRIFGGSDV